MPAYFDTSVLVSILKNDQQSERAGKLWSDHGERVSSLLFEAECIVVMRRIVLEFHGRLPADWLATQKLRFEKYLEEIHLKPVDDAVIEIIRNEEALSKCRALDALHVATALFFRAASPEEFTFYSFDQRMVEVARSVGLTVG